MELNFANSLLRNWLSTFNGFLKNLPMIADMTDSLVGYKSFLSIFKFLDLIALNQ